MYPHNMVLGRYGEMRGACSTRGKCIWNCGKKPEQSTVLNRSKCSYTTIIKLTLKRMCNNANCVFCFSLRSTGGLWQWMFGHYEWHSIPKPYGQVHNRREVLPRTMLTKTAGGTNGKQALSCQRVSLCCWAMDITPHTWRKNSPCPLPSTANFYCPQWHQLSPFYVNL